MTEPIKNPFNKDTQEAKYLTYEHAYHSRSELDNPYAKEEEPDLYGVWMKGFRANKTRPKVEMKVPLDQAEIDLESTTVVGDISSLPTDLLELELKKRKLKELQSLNQQSSQLEKQLNEVNLKITRLNVLLGD